MRSLLYLAGLTVSALLALQFSLNAEPFTDSDGSPSSTFSTWQKLGGAVQMRGSFFDEAPGGSDDDPHQNHHGNHGDHLAHIPLGVMGAHVHREGEWMVSVSAMKMRMDGLRSGKHRVSSAQTFAQGFMVAPTSMNMRMAMVSAMYGASDSLTWMVMVPWISNEMDHLTGMGGRFTTRSEGMGDVSITGLYKVYEEQNETVHLNLGFSAPTGSIKKKDRLPNSAGMDVRLPYPMQLGTGTWDVTPGVTYTSHQGDHSWGAQGLSRFHLGSNSQGYTRGDRLDLTAWFATRLDENFVTSVRVAFSDWKNISGADSNLNPAVVPTANPNLIEGQRTDLLLGLNWSGSEESMNGQQVSVELGWPVQQNLKGPALETDWTMRFGWRMVF